MKLEAFKVYVEGPVGVWKAEPAVFTTLTLARQATWNLTREGKGWRIVRETSETMDYRAPRQARNR